MIYGKASEALKNHAHDLFLLDSIGKESYSQALKAIAYDMMRTTLSYENIARHLLHVGRIEDAILTCLRAIEPTSIGPSSPNNDDPIIIERKPSSADFFQASIKYCEKKESK